MRNMSLDDFTRELSAKKPVPGGGGAAALAGALAASLSSMVVNYTIGKKRYAKYNDRLEAVINKSQMLKDKLLELIEKDAAAFEPLSKAYGLPDDTPELKSEKEAVMEKAFLHAAKAPLEIARLSGEIIMLHKELLEIGSKMVLSDVGVGVIIAKSALKSAVLNVYINTRMMQDRKTADAYNEEAQKLDSEFGLTADSVYNTIHNKLLKR